MRSIEVESYWVKSSGYFSYKFKFITLVSMKDGGNQFGVNANCMVGKNPHNFLGCIFEVIQRRPYYALGMNFIEFTVSQPNSIELVLDFLNKLYKKDG